MWTGWTSAPSHEAAGDRGRVWHGRRLRPSLCAPEPEHRACDVCGNGADPIGRSRMAFARYKGSAEEALLGAGFPHVYIFRPAYIYPVEPRREPTFGYRLLRVAYPVFRLVFPNLVIRSDDLARAMVDVSVRGTDEHASLVFESRDIVAIANSVQTHDLP
jgi:uncharacterized protein YbjT (DUF2867 family)